MPRVERQLQATIPHLSDVRHVAFEPREIRHLFSVQQVVRRLVVGVGGEADAIVEQAQVETRVVLRCGFPA